MYKDKKAFEELVGCEIYGISQIPDADGTVYEVHIHARDHDGDWRDYMMFHSQDCCENVRLHDIAGDLSDLLHAGPVLMAECVTQDAEDASESGTWTFYKLATKKGYVTLRWLGESNGYYSEEVTFARRYTQPAPEQPTERGRVARLATLERVKALDFSKVSHENLLRIEQFALRDIW